VRISRRFLPVVCMLIGLSCALGAGLMWGLVFVAPLMLAEYPGLMLSFGRYLGFGLIALIPAAFDWRRIAALQVSDWVAALKLSLVGNILYYAALASAIQLAGAPLPAMIIGTLPIVISICSNRAPADSTEAVAWMRLAPSLAIILAGLVLVNAGELETLDGRRSTMDYALGCAIALGALAAWTWYPIRNARYLKQHPHIRSSTWATAQGLATLPLAAAGFAAYGLYTSIAGTGYAFPLGPRPWTFVALMLALGLCASWLGTLLWNKSSQKLQTSLAGQLIVFETLAALLYAFLWRGSMPGPKVLAGIALLCLGVTLGLHAFRRSETVPAASTA
jgi:drug/metabolite transporter (DMT)-like permease